MSDILEYKDYVGPVKLTSEDCHLSEKKQGSGLPFKGTFNVRVGRDLHKRAALVAAERHKKLNAVVSEALEQYLQMAQ